MNRTVEWEEDEMPDSTGKSRADSIKEVRQRKTDSLQSARKQKADSIAEVRKYKESKHYKDSIAKARTGRAPSLKAPSSPADSIKEARQQRLDSAAAVRKYHDSKKYKDSLVKAREKKTKSLQAARQDRMDSLKDARQKITDSIANTRKGKTDSIKLIQKRRTDSLAAKKKYKESKRYADSVALRKREHTDSIRTAQKTVRDKTMATRKQSMDSVKAVRKQSMDSLKNVRTKQMDSVKKVRKAKTDSLAKVKLNKEKAAKAKEKKKKEDLNLKMELKIKAKHEAWSNKSMLKKRWSPIRRLTQNSFTHYNYYFNADRKMDEALQNMQRSRKENYDSLIGLYPFDPNRDSSLMLADMDSIVQKVSIGIQIHDPRVKWSNDLYLLLGQAYYYKGSYEYASIAFRYIISVDEEAKKKKAKSSGSSSKSKDGPSILEQEKKSKLNFLKHKSVHNEAILWLARTYTEAHQPENAESVLSLLEADVKLPDDLVGRLAIEKAFAFLMEDNPAAAAPQLQIAAEDGDLPNWLRLRCAFLLGQIQQNMGNYKEAASSFEQVLGYYPKIDMDFYARKYIAFNKLMAGDEAEDAMRSLKSMLHDAKYLSYHDQVYYVLGQLALKANKKDEAIAYFINSAKTPKATKKQKALSFIALGDVYYGMSRYTIAKNAYDSAAKYSTSSSKDKAVIAANNRSKGLEEIAGPTRVIAEQDSLMALSRLSKREQQQAVNRYLRYLEKKKQDSILNATAESAVGLVDPAEDKPGDGGSWYFGNTTLMQQGSEEFKRKWGNRKLTDNWRRAAALGAFANTSQGGANDNDAQDEAAEQSDSGMPTEESLLAKIPNTSQQKALSAKLEHRAYILLAKAYIKQLEDYNMASRTLDTLDSRFPAHNQKEEELYLRYQIALKQNKLDKAQAYSQELVAKFPESQYANMLRPQENRDDEKTNKAVGAYFDETYNLLLQHQYTEGLTRINAGRKQYNTSTRYQKRFDVAEAMAHAGMGDYDRADTVISAFLKANPADTLTPWATTVKDYIKQVRNGGKPSWYYDTIPAAARAAIAAKKAPPVVPKVIVPPAPVVPPAYTYNADSAHYCIIVMPGVESRTAGLKQAIRRYDSGGDTTAGLDVFFDLYSVDLGVFVVKKFANAAQAKAYVAAIMLSQVFKEFKPEEIQVYAISAWNYRKMFTDKEVVPYSSFYSAYYR